MDWRSLNNRILNESTPKTLPELSAGLPQRVIAALASTRTSALRTPAAMSVLLGISEDEIVVTLQALEQAGVAIPEWNGMAYVWRLAEATGAA